MFICLIFVAWNFQSFHLQNMCLAQKRNKTLQRFLFFYLFHRSELISAGVQGLALTHCDHVTCQDDDCVDHKLHYNK